MNVDVLMQHQCKLQYFLKILCNLFFDMGPSPPRPHLFHVIFIVLPVAKRDGVEVNHQEIPPVCTCTQ